MSEEPKVIDVMGQRCPIPVQRLRVAMRGEQGRDIHLVGDDPESLHDIPALLERMNMPSPKISEIEGGWRFVISID